MAGGADKIIRKEHCAAREHWQAASSSFLSLLAAWQSALCARCRARAHASSTPPRGRPICPNFLFPRTSTPCMLRASPTHGSEAGGVVATPTNASQHECMACCTAGGAGSLIAMRCDDDESSLLPPRCCGGWPLRDCYGIVHCSSRSSQITIVRHFFCKSTVLIMIKCKHYYYLLYKIQLNFKRVLTCSDVSVLGPKEGGRKYPGLPSTLVCSATWSGD